jgi:hypothetical protein
VSAEDGDDPVRSLGCTPASGAMFAIGTTLVTCAAQDSHLNTGSAFFKVTVNGASAQLDALMRKLDGSSLAKYLDAA